MKTKRAGVVDITYYCPRCDIYWTEPVALYYPDYTIPEHVCYRCGSISQGVESL
jgi:hypothetical protein